VNKNQKGDADCAKKRWSSNYLALIIINQVIFLFFFPGKLCDALEISCSFNAAVIMKNCRFIF
jgi:hypothetical protein